MSLLYTLRNNQPVAVRLTPTATGGTNVSSFYLTAPVRSKKEKEVRESEESLKRRFRKTHFELKEDFEQYIPSRSDIIIGNCYTACTTSSDIYTVYRAIGCLIIFSGKSLFGHQLFTSNRSKKWSFIKTSDFKENISYITSDKKSYQLIATKTRLTKHEYDYKKNLMLFTFKAGDGIKKFMNVSQGNHALVTITGITKKFVNTNEWGNIEKRLFNSYSLDMLIQSHNRQESTKCLLARINDQFCLIQ